MQRSQKYYQSGGAFLIGLVAGGIGSLVGLGGSFVALPMLTGILKMNQHVAHGTTMATVLCTSLGGSIAYGMKNWDTFTLLHDKDGELNERIGNVHLPTAMGLALSSSMTVVLGARISKRLSEKTLKFSMGGLLLLVGPLIPLRDRIRISPNSEVQKSPFPTAVMIGSVTGVISGIFGVGGGALQVPALSLLTNLDYHTILGTSLAAMLPTAIIGSITHYRQRTLLPQIAVPLGIGCLLGSFFTSKEAKKVDEKELRTVFPIVMMMLGVNAIRTALRKV